jgi:hypothetical protein
VIECIFNIGASFYTTCEQRKQYGHGWGRSESSKNKTHPNAGEQHDAELDMGYKHRQQHWQSSHGKYNCLYNTHSEQKILGSNPNRVLSFRRGNRGLGDNFAKPNIG